MRATRRLYYALALLAVLALLVFAQRLTDYQGQISPVAAADSDRLLLLEDLWRWLVFSFLALIGVDYIRSRNTTVAITRQLPPSLALGVKKVIQLELQNTHSFPLQLQLQEVVSDHLSVLDLPVDVSLSSHSHKTISYHVQPAKRGEASFYGCQVRIVSRLGFWRFQKNVKTHNSAKIYPNFAPVVSSLSLGLSAQIAQLGIHLQQRRGEGSEFQQLREFREGDAMRQIDWNATARHRKPISREYQDETDQEIVFLLDCGRRLRHQDGETSHFDHALNALLLCAYIALRQGDAVGMNTFAGAKRWFAPVKHPKQINALLNQLYDLDSTTDASDYLMAAQALISRYRKRALVVIITSVREEDCADLQAAVQLLQQRHLVLVANIRDASIDGLLEHPVDHIEDALRYCATTEYQQNQQQYFHRLSKQGVVVADALAPAMHLRLVQSYLQIKRSGKL